MLVIFITKALLQAWANEDEPGQILLSNKEKEVFLGLKSTQGASNTNHHTF